MAYSYKKLGYTRLIKRRVKRSQLANHVCPYLYGSPAAVATPVVSLSVLIVAHLTSKMFTIALEKAAFVTRQTRGE